MATITLGGKGSWLSSSSVFSISTGASRVRIDSSALDRVSSESPIQSDHTSSVSLPEYLSCDECRAALTALLNRLLLSSDPRIGPDVLLRVCQFLNSSEPAPTTVLDQISVSVFDALQGLLPVAALYGVAAVVDHMSAALSSVIDAVAALSCEALRANTKGAFDLTDSGDGHVNKDEVIVSSDMSVLLRDSKLSSKDKPADLDEVRQIPKIHASLRGAARSTHATARVGLNSAEKFEDAGKTVATRLSSLASALRYAGESSLRRARLNLKAVNDGNLRAGLVALFDPTCPNGDSLKEAFKSASHAGFDDDYGKFVHEVNALLGLVREVVAWEAITAFVALEGGELSGQKSGTVEVNGEGKNARPDKKAEKKKKKKKVLGNGTEVMVELIKDRVLRTVAGDAIESMGFSRKCVEVIKSILDPRTPDFCGFSEKVKEIVESNASRRLPKLPKGTRDFGKEQMAIRKRAFSIIEEVFERHGATALDTPVFELRETLTGKYGEDSKLIYDLADQGGELCSLRYDLTVPFARYVAMNGLTSLKRYQIAKVYRRDNPSKGRFREFYQCDFDIAGQYERMGPDFEVVKIMTELLDELNIGDYEVKLNHRKLLDGMLEICGVPAEKFRTICSSIDKLDKQPFEQIKREMVEEKGLTSVTADRIGNFVKERGSPMELLFRLKQEGSEFLKNNDSVQALHDLEILFKALEKSKCISKVVFDLSLARGLDYYTGVIFEAVFKGSTQVGSIAAGGRYDNLIGMFGSKQVPAVGVSLGIERVFAIMEQLQKDKNEKIRATKTQVLVGILGDDVSEAAELASEFWEAKIETEFVVSKRAEKHINRATESGIPWLVLAGERERNAGIVKLKDIEAKKEEEIPRRDIVKEVKRRLKC